MNHSAKQKNSAFVAEVRRDVKDHRDALKPGGRYIAGSSHSIVNFIPHENFLAMLNAFHEYGRY